MNGEKKECWIEAGFAGLSRSGVEGVRVEVLAKSLGVTSGSFYRRFKDRAALQSAMLADWSADRLATIEQQAALDGETARQSRDRNSGRLNRKPFM
jgi:AcrR family transcriptional regulator